MLCDRGLFCVEGGSQHIIPRGSSSLTIALTRLEKTTENARCFGDPCRKMWKGNEMNPRVLRLMLCVCAFAACLFTCGAQSNIVSFYQAEGRSCPSCTGSGHVTCSYCKGEDLTTKTCLYCKGEDLTQRTCLYCRGEDLTRKTCEHCKGEDLTRLVCANCKGEDLTQRTCNECGGTGRLPGRRCYHCYGTGKHPRCIYCHGTRHQSRCVYCRGSGKQSRCVYCRGTAKQSRCLYCRGTGKQSRCLYCGGKAASSAICATCNGEGGIEVLTAKYNSIEDFKKGIAAHSQIQPRAPPVLTADTGSNGSIELFNPLVAEDGSHYGDSVGSSTRNVFVSGYYHRGSYVKSHFRSVSPASAEKVRFFSSSPFVAENGSFYGEPNKFGIPKTVHVNGYFRGDGTYVRGHFRSSPHR
jgi:hypothetical protein